MIGKFFIGLQKPLKILRIAACIPGGIQIIKFASDFYNVPGMGHLAGSSCDNPILNPCFPQHTIQQRRISLADSSPVHQCPVRGKFQIVIGIVIDNRPAHITVNGLNFLIIAHSAQIKIRQYLSNPLGHRLFLIPGGIVIHQKLNMVLIVCHFRAAAALIYRHNRIFLRWSRNPLNAKLQIVSLSSFRGTIHRFCCLQKLISKIFIRFLTDYGKRNIFLPKDQLFF